MSDASGGSSSRRIPEVAGYSDLVEVGRGGFAVVYRAQQDRFRRTVALKVVTRIDVGDRMARRFAREAEALGALSWHPNIVVVHDAGVTDDGQPYLAMEYLERGTIGDRLQSRGPLPWTAAVAIGVQVSGALETAHRAGVLHRDLKPENILLDAFGDAKLSDFGIAGVAGGGATTTGHAAFTVAHAAPEVLLGQPATERSDVYSLASTIYHLIAGRSAFAGDTDESAVAMALRVTTAPRPDLSLLDIPAELAAVLSEAMALEPATRPATAADFGHALQAGQQAAGVPVTAMRLLSTPQAEADPPQDPASAPDTEPTVVVGPSVPLPPPPAVPPPPPGPPTAPPPAPPPTLPPPPGHPEPAPLPGYGATSESPRRSRRGWIVGAGVVAVVLLIGGLLAVALGGGDDGGGSGNAESGGGGGGGGGGAAPPASDGTFRIGTLLPETGSLAFLGPPMFAGVDLAVEDINDAGGVLGADLPPALHGDSGDTETDLATATTDDLLGQDADVIVGAASSGVSLTVIDEITRSGVIQISPSNTATDFTDYPDSGLYFRTAPSDTMQGKLLGEVIAEDGHQRLAILVIDDPYGANLAPAVEASFNDQGGEVVEQIEYDPFASDFGSEVAQVKAAEPDAIAVIGFDESGAILNEMIAQGIGPLDVGVYGTDGNMGNALGDQIDEAGALEGMRGTTPLTDLSQDFLDRLLDVDPDLVDFNYAGESYDAVVITTLAAAIAGTVEDREAIAAEINGVTKDGEKCETYADCLALVEAGTDIDYDGPSGPQEFGDAGEPTTASYGVLTFGADNFIDDALTEFRFGEL